MEVTKGKIYELDGMRFRYDGMRGKLAHYFTRVDNEESFSGRYAEIAYTTDQLVNMDLKEVQEVKTVWCNVYYLPYDKTRFYISQSYDSKAKALHSAREKNYIDTIELKIKLS